MRITAAEASRGQLHPLLDRILATTAPGPGVQPADLGLFFATNHFEDDMKLAVERVREATKVRTLIGCTAEAVIGPEHEHEHEPAMSLWLAHLPGVRIQPFHLTQEEIENDRVGQTLLPGLESTPSARATENGSQPAILLLGDPFSIDVNAMLGAVNEHLPGCPLIGGMASGAEKPGQAVLICDGDIHQAGAVGVTLSGPITVGTVVSQGCRPIGRPFIITKAERNVILELGGKKPLQVLNRIYSKAPEADQRLMQRGIFVGRVIDEQRPEFRRGDFLIRSLVGADEKTGAIAVGDLVRAGTTIQFQVRDADAADEDLRAMLTQHAGSTSSSGGLRPPLAGSVGALLFSCNGRGTRLFPQRDHDVGLLRDLLGPMPVAGFFCAGELGPVGGKNFIHGHTASIAIFRALDKN